jgi:chitinase
LELHRSLGDKEAFPPKRILVTTFLPSAWADDALIAERRTELGTYLDNLIKNEAFRNSSTLETFLSRPASARVDKDVSLEDVLPSTLSRKAALAAQAGIAATSRVAAAYYPDWSADTVPPESLDYSRFDILFFGKLFGGIKEADLT